MWLCVSGNNGNAFPQCGKRFNLVVSKPLLHVTLVLNFNTHGDTYLHTHRYTSRRLVLVIIVGNS